VVVPVTAAGNRRQRVNVQHLQPSAQDTQSAAILKRATGRIHACTLEAGDLGHIALGDFDIAASTRAPKA